MTRPFAYITAPWGANEFENTEDAAAYCRKVFDAGFAPICPLLFLPLFINDAIPQEHKDGLDIGHEMLRRSRVLVVCGDTVDEAMKADIAIAERLRITATTLDGILTVKGQGRSGEWPMTISFTGWSCRLSDTANIRERRNHSCKKKLKTGR